MSLDSQGGAGAAVSAPEELPMLAPQQVSLLHSAGGVLRAVVAGEEYGEVLLYRLFPLSHPERYLSLRTAAGDEIGLIADLRDLDADSRQAAQQELRLRYLTSRVVAVQRITEQPGLWTWEVQTDRGPLRLLMRNLHEHLQAPGPGRLLITDMDGRRCEISDVAALDAHSRAELARVL